MIDGTYTSSWSWDGEGDGVVLVHGLLDPIHHAWTNENVRMSEEPIIIVEI